MNWKTGVIGLAFAMAATQASAQGIPVYDASAIAQFVQQLAQMKQQLDVARQELAAMSGNRGLGAILNDPEIRAALPSAWEGIGDDAVYRTAIERLANEEALAGDDLAALSDALGERQRNSSLTNKAIGMRAMEGAQARLRNLDGLMAEIQRTQDPKSIAELQARISIEQANIETEMTKLQAIAQLQQAEKELMELQEDAIFKRMMNPTNTGMPRIR